MDDVLSNEYLVSNTNDLILTVLVEEDDIVNVRTVTHELVFLQSCTDESLCAVDIQLLVCLSHLRSLDSIERTYLCKTWMLSTILLLQMLEPLARYINHAVQIALYLLNLSLNLCHQLVCLVLRELGNALHLYFEKTENIFLSYLTNKEVIEWCQTFVDMLTDAINTCGILEFLILVYTLLNEYLLQRNEE